MFKNIKLKKALKNTVFKLATAFNVIVPKSNMIVLLYSSNRGINNNLGALKKYMMDNEYYKKYSIICGIENTKYAEDDRDKVKYYTKIKSFLIFFVSGHVFYSSGQIPIKPSKKQVVVHLDHGTATYKKCGALSNINNGDEFFFTYYLAPSKLYVPIVQKTFLCPRKCIKICGEAVTDIFYKKVKPYDMGTYSKLILWAPTFRQSDYYGYDDSKEELIPMFKPNEYDELNEHLKKHDFKLILKLHPGQSLKEYEHNHYSHLEIYSDEDFKKKGYDLYKMLMQVDCLIGDYSSVHLQFLLLDRPMAFVIPDFDEYEKRRGSVFDDPQKFMPGEHVTTKEQLFSVFEKWDEGIDEHKEWRGEIRNLIHEFQDGDNAKRALEISGVYI